MLSSQWSLEFCFSDLGLWRSKFVILAYAFTSFLYFQYFCNLHTVRLFIQKFHLGRVLRQIYSLEAQECMYFQNHTSVNIPELRDWLKRVISILQPFFKSEYLYLFQPGSSGESKILPFVVQKYCWHLLILQVNYNFQVKYLYLLQLQIKDKNSLEGEPSYNVHS